MWWPLAARRFCCSSSWIGRDATMRRSPLITCRLPVLFSWPPSQVNLADYWHARPLVLDLQNAAAVFQLLNRSAKILLFQVHRNGFSFQWHNKKCFWNLLWFNNAESAIWTALPNGLLLNHNGSEGLFGGLHLQGIT